MICFWIRNKFSTKFQQFSFQINVRLVQCQCQRLHYYILISEKNANSKNSKQIKVNQMERKKIRRCFEKT